MPMDHDHRGTIWRHADAPPRRRGLLLGRELGCHRRHPIDAYISTRKQKHGERPGPLSRGPLPTTATRVDRMSRKLHRKAGAPCTRRAKRFVEAVFGQISSPGFRQFCCVGSRKVQGEWSARVHDPQHSEVVSIYG